MPFFDIDLESVDESAEHMHFFDWNERAAAIMDCRSAVVVADVDLRFRVLTFSPSDGVNCVFVARAWTI